jgi:hypothetical protein
LAVTVAYGSQLGSFARELFAFKAEFDSFGVGAVADLAELVFPCNTADRSVWTGARSHFWAFFACDSANSNFHSNHLLNKKKLNLIILTAFWGWINFIALACQYCIGETYVLPFLF